MKRVDLGSERNTSREIHRDVGKRKQLIEANTEMAQMLGLSEQDFKMAMVGIPVMAQRKQISLASMRTQLRSLASLSGLRIQHCCELWCRLQTQLGSGIAVAVV